MPIDLFLVDTSVWIMALRRDFMPAAKDRVEYLLLENKAAVCDMIRLELLGGTRTQKEFSKLRSRLSSLHQLETTWEDAYDLAFALRRKGVSVPHTDILIAASALSSGAILLHNDSHFDLIAANSSLSVEKLPGVPV